MRSCYSHVYAKHTQTHTHTHPHISFLKQMLYIHVVLCMDIWSHKLWVINPLYFALMQKLKGKFIWTHIIIFSFCCSFSFFFFFELETEKRKSCGFGGWYYTYMGLTFFYISQLFIFVFPIFDFFIFHIHMFVYICTMHTYIPHTFPPQPKVVGEKFPMF